MPYDPIRDAADFRGTLKRLAEVEHLTSQAIIDLFNKQRVRGDNLSISRATLDRFVQGEEITKIRELRVIHELLRTHPTYRAYFGTAPEPEGERETDAAGSLAQLFGAWFAPDSIAPDGATMPGMLAALPGQYVMMRRDHDPITVENGVRVSMLTLGAELGGLRIEENQSYRTPDYDMPFEQTDRGYLFSHGQYIYFLMKETGGTAVKFGVIQLVLPELDRGVPAQYFQGHIMVVSRRGVFPRTRFAARRFSANQHPVSSGICRLTEIADPRAIDFLRPDYTDGGAAKPA